MIILDQLGHVFGRTEKGLSNKVEDAINLTSYESILNKKQKQAIKKLRNCLCHNFGLCSYSPTKKMMEDKYTFLFDEYKADKAINSITKEESSDIELVEVNIFSLCNMVESILLKYVDKYKSGALDSALDKDVLRARFLIND